jgi:hypothetical protein
MRRHPLCRLNAHPGAARRCSPRVPHWCRSVTYATVPTTYAVGLGPNPASAACSLGSPSAMLASPERSVVAAFFNALLGRPGERGGRCAAAPGHGGGGRRMEVGDYTAAQTRAATRWVAGLNRASAELNPSAGTAQRLPFRFEDADRPSASPSEPADAWRARPRWGRSRPTAPAGRGPTGSSRLEPERCLEPGCPRAARVEGGSFSEISVGRSGGRRA